MNPVVSQISTILFAVIFAWQQSSAIKAFRDYVPVNNPYMGKYHKAGWLVAALVVTVISVLSTGISFYILVNALWYWLFLDGALNKFTGKPVEYIGETSWIDKQLRSLNISGSDKALFISFTILVLNVILYK